MIVCVKVLFVICTVFVAIALGFQHPDEYAKIEPKFVVDKTQITNGMTTGIWKVWKPWLVKKQDILKNMDKKLNSMLLLVPTSMSHSKPSTSAVGAGALVTETVSENAVSGGSNTGVKIPAISVHVGGSNNNAVQHLAQRPAPVVYFYHVTASAKPSDSNLDKNHGDKTENHGGNGLNVNSSHNHSHNNNHNSMGHHNNSGNIFPPLDSENHPSIVEHNSTGNVTIPVPVASIPSVVPNYFIPVLLTTNLGAHNASIPHNPISAPMSPMSPTNTQTNYGGNTFINVGYPEHADKFSNSDKTKKVFRYKGLTMKGLENYNGIIVFLPQCIRGDTSCRGAIPGIKTYTSNNFHGKLKPLKPNDPEIMIATPNSDLEENESTTSPSLMPEIDLVENGNETELDVIGGQSQPNGNVQPEDESDESDSKPDIFKYILRKDYH